MSRSLRNPDDVIALIHEADTAWARVCLALAFYCDPATYGVSSRTGARQVGRDAPIDRDLGRVARALMEAGPGP